MHDVAVSYGLADAARKARLTTHQARNYVQFRLVCACARTSAGRMRFDEPGVRRLRLIGRALVAGLSIKDTRQFLAALDSADGDALKRDRETFLARVRERRRTLDQLVRERDQACASPERYQPKGGYQAAPSTR